MKDVIISDFDETITKRDTIAILGELPYRLKPGLKPRWSHFEDTYMQSHHDFQKMSQDSSHMNNIKRPLPIMAEPAHPISVSNFNVLFEHELKFQANKRLLELTSTTEIAKYEIFKDVTHSQVRHYVNEKFQGDSSLIRRGFEDFITSIKTADFYIVSVNWSTEFIQQVTGKDLITMGHIFCNELLSDGDVYTGQFSNSLLTGSDKIAVLDKILNQYDNDENYRYWYIGDSETDVLSILHPKTNGVLLIDPRTEGKKFKTLTTELLGLPEDEVSKFAEDHSTGWLKCYEKNRDNNVYLVKSWLDLKHLFLHQTP